MNTNTEDWKPKVMLKLIERGLSDRTVAVLIEVVEGKQDKLNIQIPRLDDNKHFCATGTPGFGSTGYIDTCMCRLQRST